MDFSKEKRERMAELLGCEPSADGLRQSDSTCTRYTGSTSVEELSFQTFTVSKSVKGVSLLKKHGKTDYYFFFFRR